jgi:hypothetical protein
VPEEGVEPTHSCEYGILSPARLPVPPFRPELRIISRNGSGAPADMSPAGNLPYWRVPFHVPLQEPPLNVPVKERRSLARVALNV